MKTSQDKIDLLQRFIQWREKHITNKQFVLILSFLVGIFTALAAYVLKFLVEYIKEFLTENFDPMGANWLYLVYPVAGIFITSLFIRKVVRDDISHGVTKILYAISRKQSRIKRHNIWSSVCASAITIGCGGSVGAEAPIVLTGSAIGSNLGSIFRMDHKTLMLLVGCGAAGCFRFLFVAGNRSHVSVSSGLSFFVSSNSLCYWTGYILRASGLVFYSFHELDRRYLPAVF